MVVEENPRPGQARPKRDAARANSRQRAEQDGDALSRLLARDRDNQGRLDRRDSIRRRRGPGGRGRCRPVIAEERRLRRVWQLPALEVGPELLGDHAADRLVVDEHQPGSPVGAALEAPDCDPDPELVDRGEQPPLRAVAGGRSTHGLGLDEVRRVRAEDGNGRDATAGQAFVSEHAGVPPDAETVDEERARPAEREGLDGGREPGCVPDHHELTEGPERRGDSMDDAEVGLDFAGVRRHAEQVRAVARPQRRSCVRGNVAGMAAPGLRQGVPPRDDDDLPAHSAADDLARSRGAAIQRVKASLFASCAAYDGSGAGGRQLAKIAASRSRSSPSTNRRKPTR